jgi:hypothetical protein
MQQAQNIRDVLEAIHREVEEEGHMLDKRGAKGFAFSSGPMTVAINLTRKTQTRCASITPPM